MTPLPRVGLVHDADCRSRLRCDFRVSRGGRDGDDGILAVAELLPRCTALQSLESVQQPIVHVHVSRCPGSIEVEVF